MVRLINRFYGRDDLPVGALLPLDDSVSTPDYAKSTVQSFDAAPLGDAGDAAAQLRHLLESADDGSVIVVSLGFFDNFIAFLDGASAGGTSACDLVQRKVERTVVMGGLFPSGREFNVAKSPALAQRFVREWPGPIEFLGWEAGVDVVTGIELSRTGGPDNPVAEAYRHYSGVGGGRSSWDLMTVDVAVRGASEDFVYSPEGRVEVSDDGTSTWLPESDGPHRFLIRTAAAEDVAAHLDAVLARTPAWRFSEVGS